MDNITLNNLYKDWVEGKGVLSILTDNYDVPWKNKVEGSILDLDFHGNHSGQKIISPLVRSLISKDGLSDSTKVKLAGVIFYRNNLNWSKLWETMILEYNPLENYRATETRKYVVGEQQVSFNKGSESQEYLEGAQVVTLNSGERTSSSKNDISGYNSDGYVSDTASSSTSGAYTDTSNYGERTNRNSLSERTDTTTNGRREDIETYEKSGNIGVTTSQKLISDERSLWDWKFFDRVFSDIDEILVTNLFSDELVEYEEFTPQFYTLPVANSTTLGGVKPVSKSVEMNQEVGVDSEGRLYTNYVLPVASSNILGGVKAVSKTEDMTGVIGVDSSGLLWYKHQESTPVVYTDYLPQSNIRVINASVSATKVTPKSNNTSIELDLRGFYEVGDFIIVNVQTTIPKNILMVSYSDNQYSDENLSVSKYIERSTPTWGSFFLRFTNKVPSFVYIQVSSSTASSGLLAKDINLLVDVYKRVV